MAKWKLCKKSKQKRWKITYNGIMYYITNVVCFYGLEYVKFGMFLSWKDNDGCFNLQFLGKVDIQRAVQKAFEDYEIPPNIAGRCT